MTKTTMTGQVGISAESLASSAKKAAKGGLPPVDKWNPEFCGDLDMRIARDGTWFYLGTPIGRHELVKLFSSILRKDGDDFFLVTPVEKVGITVDDAPFVAVDFAREGDALRFVTNVEDEVLAGPDHPIRAAGDHDSPAIYLHVRRGCEARLNRSTYEQLARIALGRGDDWTVTSGGESFSLLPA